jgi:hypothetical protein
MESAVRSGFLAAEAIWKDIGRARRLAHAVRPTDGLAGRVRALTWQGRKFVRRSGPVLA